MHCLICSKSSPIQINKDDKKPLAVSFPTAKGFVYNMDSFRSMLEFRLYGSERLLHNHLSIIL